MKDPWACGKIGVIKQIKSFAKTQLRAFNPLYSQFHFRRGAGWWFLRSLLSTSANQFTYLPALRFLREKQVSEGENSK